MENYNYNHHQNTIKQLNDIINSKQKTIEELSKTNNYNHNNNSNNITVISISISSLPDFLGETDEEKFLKAISYINRYGVYPTK